MSAVVKVRGRGSLLSNRGGWVRVVFGYEHVPADPIRYSFTRGTSLHALAVNRGLPLDIVEAVIRWYLNNPSENPYLGNTPKLVDR